LSHVARALLRQPQESIDLELVVNGTGEWSGMSIINGSIESREEGVTYILDDSLTIPSITVTGMSMLLSTSPFLLVIVEKLAAAASFATATTSLREIRIASNVDLAYYIIAYYLSASAWNLTYECAGNAMPFMRSMEYFLGCSSAKVSFFLVESSQRIECVNASYAGFVWSIHSFGDCGFECPSCNTRDGDFSPSSGVIQ
jgi:hypothetical protein